jgi:stage III sporulation protein AA
MPWRASLSAYLPPPLLHMVEALPPGLADRVCELRLRAGRPLEWVLRHGEPGGEGVGETGWIPEARDVALLARSFLEHSAYAHQEELRQGYLTLPGGHRVGLCGRAVLSDGRLTGLTDIASLCVRVARAAPGVADWLLPLLLPAGEAPCGALLFSAPGMGKTTLLRDAVRQLSDLHGRRVGVVDERSEIAGCVRGVPRLDVGRRTDVLDACPKAAGMMLLLRGMAPQWLAVDEIGRAEDADALLEAARCGVPVLATAHAGDFGELLGRPTLRRLAEARAFRRYVELGPLATEAGVWDRDGRPLSAREAR